MNAIDPFEAELRALQPRETSPSLKRRIAEELRASASPEALPRASPQDSSLWSIPLACALAAACAFAIALWWTDDISQPRQIVVYPPAPPGVSAENVSPTVLAYRRALERSPEALDLLLDRHANFALRAEPQQTPLRAFTRPDFEPSSPGEL